MSNIDYRLKIIDIAKKLHFCLISRPYYLYKFLLSGNKYYSGKTYFPDKKSKSHFKIWMDQLFQTLKYGFPNELYYTCGFDVKNKREIGEYLHYAPFARVRDRLNSAYPSEIIILRDKFLFGMFAEYLGVNTAENIGITESSGIYDTLQKIVVPTIKFLREMENEDLFIKPYDGQCGKGILHLIVKNGTYTLNGEKVSVTDLASKLESERYLLQRAVVQHNILSSLHKKSINTIRLVTIRNRVKGRIDVFPSILRIGTASSFVDNTSQGGIAVGIDLNTGKLHEFGFYKPEFGTKTDEHPDSKIKFSEVTIPYFDECKSQAIRLHSMLPQLHSIGWDIAIGPQGPIFIEGNDRWEITGPQNCNGGLKNLFMEYAK